MSDPRPPDRPRRARRGLPALFVTLLALALLVPAPAALGVIYQVTFRTSIGACYVDGTGPANTTFTVTLKNAAGKKKASRQVTAGPGFGAWHIDCLAKVAPGDVFYAQKKIGGSLFTLRKFSVPVIVPRFDRVTNKVAGKAPKRTWLELTAGRCELDGSCAQKTTGTVRASSTGAWSRSMAGVGYDPRGGDLIAVEWSDASTFDVDTVAYNDFVNRIEVVAGSAVVRGYGDPGAVVRITFLNAANKVRGTGTARASRTTGRFKVTVRTKSGAPVALAATNKVVGSVASNAKLTVGASLGVDLSDTANDHLQGHCYPDQPYLFRVDDHVTPVVFSGIADPTGFVEQTNATGQVPMASGIDVTLVCQTAAGDRVQFSRTVP